MEAKWIAVTAVAPLAWGATYVVTRQLLPADAPLWGAAIRALPAGMLLLLLARQLPRGAWWWRSAVLGSVNIGAFFLLVYVAAQALPSSVAASIMALAPLALSGFAWWLLAQRPTVHTLVGAVGGITGVVLLVGGARGELAVSGVLASASALGLSAFGSVLATRWADDTPVLATTAWQLVAGGALLTLAAIAVEGRPPAVGPAAAAGYVFTSVVATALAFVCWFAGLRRIRAGAVGVIGLLNPVTGVVLGSVLAQERLAPLQLAGVALTLAAIAVVTRAPSHPGARARRGPVPVSVSPAVASARPAGRAVRRSGRHARLTRRPRAARSAPSGPRP
ncbi:MAG: EamA family transporter [Aeromicrobium sp.]|uniref:EamA family transporter n=1 Tax=Aeromicrobium sp. TaxID=1871063 RepID=UPI0026188335|nr:EamA family transporter [Aeromicrobium sp.]MDF1703135.1 EamA family transporter [Aeromicrobium sp.]